MNKLFLAILYTITLFIALSYNLFAANYYVGLTASGSGNGSNWANRNAWSNDWWGSVNAGDYVWVDGGVDSVVYTSGKFFGKSGSAGNYIYIMPGRYSPDPTNHSGKVILNTTGVGFECAGAYSWIYLKGFTIRNASRGLNIYGSSHHLVFDSLTILFCTGENMHFEYTSYIEVKNCVVINRRNNVPIDDNCVSQWIHHFFVHDNYFHQRNLQFGANNNHIDNWQVANWGYAFYFYNNVCITDSMVRGHNIILGCKGNTANYSDTVFVFNNYFYDGGNPGCNTQRSVYLRNPEQGGYVYQAYMINNTVVTANWGVPAFEGEGGRTYASNNIFINLGVNCTTPSACENGNWTWGQQGDAVAKYTRVDSCHTNLAWRCYNANPSFYGGGFLRLNNTVGTPTSWSDFINNYGGTGVNDNPDLANNHRFFNSRYPEPWNTNASSEPFALESTSPAIDAGTDMTYVLQKFAWLPGININEDIAGNPRNGAWDIGAYEYGVTTDTTADLSFIPASVTNAALNSYHTAYGVFTDVDTTFWVLSYGAQDTFKLGVHGVWDVQADTAHAGDTVYVSNPASGTNGVTTYRRIIVSGVTKQFPVTTVALPDSIPDAISIIDYNFANLSTTYTSLPFILENFDSCYAYFDGANFTIRRGGSWGSPSSTMRKVYDADSIRLSLTSSSSNGLTVNANFTAGATSDNWKITTKTAGGTIDTLDIADATGKISEANHPPTNAIDGLVYGDDEDSRWSAEPMPLSITFDLSIIKTFVRHATSFAFYFEAQIYQYSVDVSNDGVNYYNVIPQSTSASGEWTIDLLNVGYEVRYVRINHISNALENEWAGEYETYLFGVPASAASSDSTASFSFDPVLDAALNSEYTAISAITGTDTVAHFWTTTGAEFKINYNGTYNTSMKTANPDDGPDSVYVKNMTGGLYEHMYTETIVGGGIARNFDVTTRALTDSTPSFTTFTDILNAELDSTYTSVTRTLTNFDSCYVRAGGYEYSVNSGGWVTGWTKVYNNYTIQLRRTSATGYLQTVNTPFTAGGASTDTWSITTKSPGGVVNGGVMKERGGTRLYDRTGKVIILRTP